MALLYLEPLHPRTSKGDVLTLLHDQGGIARGLIGKIEFHGGQAVVEIPEGWDARLVKALSGATLYQKHLRAWIGGATAIGSGEDHFQRLLRLLDVESRAEATQSLERIRRLSAEEAERNGHSLVGLVIDDEYTGLGGSFILTLVKRNRTLPLPWTRLGTGSPVMLTAEACSHPPSFRAVVSERGEDSIRVALNDLPDELEEHASWRVDACGDEVAHQRQRTALEMVRSATGGRLAKLRQVLLGERAPTFDPIAPYTPLNPALNPSQQSAVQFALSAEDLAIIHGPPGTGKTTTVVELVRQAVARGEKVLACAPSNLGVDNLLERLVAAGENAVRLGHPARVLPQLREHTLDLMVEEHKDVRIAHKLVREALALRRKAERHTRAKPAPGARREMRQEARELLADARRLEQQTVERILDGATVLCCTLTGLSNDLLGKREFDLAVIDEAGQSTEPPCWIPLLRSRRVVLAGDHCQLPPTVLSRDAAAQGFGVSLMERLVALAGAEISRRLKVQYRMHAAIMEFPSIEFYEAELEADEGVRSHLLVDLPGIEANALTEAPLHFIDTAGAGYEEQLEPDGESRQNPQEARLVERKVRELLAAGLPPQDVAVIAPYAAQVRLIREEMQAPGVEIDTVDGFQGREKEAVVVSLVRSNGDGEIGFLADTRRMNVALTRARRKLIVIGDSATLSGHHFYKSLFDYFESCAAYHTVWEES